MAVPMILFMMLNLSKSGPRLVRMPGRRRHFDRRRPSDERSCMMSRARGVGPIVCFVETEPSQRSLDFGPRGSRGAEGGGERLAAARRKPALLAAGLSGHPGHDPARAARQADPPWPGGLEAAHFGAVLTGEGPVQRQRGLVGPAAIPAVPASWSRLHNALGRPASDFNRDATRLRSRPSARPQSPVPEAVVVVLPTDSRWLVVQWRRVRPALARTDAPRPDVSESHCRCWVSMSATRFLPRPAAGTRLGSGVGPSEGVGNLSLHPHWPGPPGYAGRARGEMRAKSRPNHACARVPRAAIVARSQLQRKQRLDAMAPRGIRIEGDVAVGEGHPSAPLTNRSEPRPDARCKARLTGQRSAA